MSAHDPGRFGKVGVLLGGRSAEREISLISGNAVLESLRRSGVDAHPFDPKERGLEDFIAERFARVFVILHGRFGEDGTVQGVLEWLGTPYTGSGVMASAQAMDQWRTKLLWQSTGIPTPPYALVSPTTDLDELVRTLGLPLMVKPVSEGSSIGVTRVDRREDLAAAIASAQAHDPLVLVERFISGTELTASILGDEALPLIRIEAEGANYDYHAKYFSDATRYHCPSGLPTDLETRLREVCLRAFRLVGCRGWGRVDLMLDASGNPWLLEVNTAPGMTGHSLVPMAARAAGLDFDALVLRILESAHVEA